ncbi:Undecaprenyl phosphate-alpha-4-amino-4-deoxy-L-arabinose arabinosyl transferase [Candidatus Anstonella stagnisolia]|nr:Undecaprenyl phosphate-alpha-4-amino-4-deoxy-L-arabinose arabinosyl transferase [Candidatus Anstonella stagnisolia]
MKIKNIPSTAQWLIIILLLYFLLRLPFITTLPLLKDENLYSLMADEMLSSPGLLPTMFGQQLAWRPALPFYILAPASSLLLNLPLPVEFAYRFPSVLFGAACVLLLFQFVRELYGNEELALISAAIFAFNPLVIYVNNTVLVDSLLLFFMLLSLLCYVRGIKKEKYFLAAAAFAFLAFMVKTVVALIIPFLAIALLFFHSRKSLSNKYFLLSLLAIPLALGVYCLMFPDKQMLFDELSKNVTQKLPSVAADSQLLTLLNRFWGSLWIFLAFCIVWLGFYASGIFLYWRKYPFLVFWCLFIAFAISGGAGMPWYYLPIMPALSVFAALPILAGQRADKFTFVAISSLLLVSAGLSAYFYVQNTFGFSTMHEKNAGIYLQGKNNTLLIGSYPAGILFYKTHFENPRTTFCWVNMFAPQNASEEMVRSYVYNYSGFSPPTSYSRLTDFFWEQRDFKLPCNAPVKFDYIASVGINRSILRSLPDYKFSSAFGSNITVYERIK